MQEKSSTSQWSSRKVRTKDTTTITHLTNGGGAGKASPLLLKQKNQSMRNVRKIRGHHTPMIERTIGATQEHTAGWANADGKTDSNNTGNSSNSDTNPHKWVFDVKGIADALCNVYEKIVNPLLYSNGKYAGNFTIGAKQENNTIQYLVVGGVIIVALVLVLKYTQK